MTQKKTNQINVDGKKIVYVAFSFLVKTFLRSIIYFSYLLRKWAILSKEFFEFSYNPL